MKKKKALKNLRASENLTCASLIEILSSSSVPRGFCLNWTRSRVEMQPLGAVGTWVRAAERAPQGYDTGHCQKVRGNLAHKAVKCNLTAYFSPQSPGLRPGEAGRSWALRSRFPTRCSLFSGCPGQMRLNLQRATCLEPQMVGAALKGRGALVKTPRVSEKWGRYLKPWLHRRDFRFCIALPVCQVLKWRWCRFMGVIDFATLAFVLDVGMWDSGRQNRLVLSN